jgi:hypothetical protein
MIFLPDRLLGKFRFVRAFEPNRTERSAFAVTG